MTPDFQQEKDKLVSSAGSVATTSTPLEEDPRLDELALHAVRSKHQVFDMVFDESFPVDIEKDIKFSLVKTKLPLGSKCDGVCSSFYHYTWVFLTNLSIHCSTFSSIP